VGDVLQLLRTRRWLGFTAVVIGAIIAFGLLSTWQWHRAEIRRAERIALQTASQGEPTPLGAIALASGVSPGDEWRSVTAQGRYLPDAQAAVRKRPLDARNGFWMMTALATDDGPVVWVNRGWMPAGADALATPPFPPPPPGEVTVTGYLRILEAGEPGGNDGLPTGQIAAPAAALLPAVSGTLPAYLQLRSSDPEQDGLIILPLPEVDEGRNVSYAVQWILFAFVAVGGWFFFLRREAQEDAERTAGAAAGQQEG
jgi:cytochrome oxidase assembly protein ShyY1